jgi:hypothetical protein
MSCAVNTIVGATRRGRPSMRGGHIGPPLHFGVVNSTEERKKDGKPDSI